jgi:hypothetical protein
VPGVLSRRYSILGPCSCLQDKFCTRCLQLSAGQILYSVPAVLCRTISVLGTCSFLQTKFCTWLLRFFAGQILYGVPAVLCKSYSVLGTCSYLQVKLCTRCLQYSAGHIQCSTPRRSLQAIFCTASKQRGKLPVIVNTVIKFLVRWQKGKFLSSWKTVVWSQLPETYWNMPKSLTTTYMQTVKWKRSLATLHNFATLATQWLPPCFQTFSSFFPYTFPASGNTGEYGVLSRR